MSTISIPMCERPLNNSENNKQKTHEIILESISDGVFTVDHDWRITSFNRAAEEITGTPRDEAVGRFCWEVFRSNMCEANCALKRTMKEGRTIADSSAWIINSRQERVPIGVSTAVLKNSDGAVLGGVETFRDHSLVEALRRELSGAGAVAGMESHSPVMKRILDILPPVAESESTVLIEGETGTGKEVMARALHQLSNRSERPFIAVNCGALPDNLLESELFGYKAGAFTDAVKDKPGLFEAARGGTILLDELGETSAAFQVKLLRVLEEREYLPLGAVEAIKIDTRILAATNADLEQMVADGRFRSDLFYRINIIRFSLPPLRQRREDLSLLITGFVRTMNQRLGREIRGLSPEAMALLLSYDYPGNIRELENIIEHGFVLCRGVEIGMEHLPPALNMKREDSNTSVGKISANTAAQLSEAEIIVSVLKRCFWNRQLAAKELGMHRSTLFRKIKKYAITLPDKDGRSSSVAIE